MGLGEFGNLFGELAIFAAVASEGHVHMGVADHEADELVRGHFHLENVTTMRVLDFKSHDGVLEGRAADEGLGLAIGLEAKEGL